MLFFDRSKSLSTLRGTGGVRIQVARPWLKKKTPLSPSLTEEQSSGEEEGILERRFSLGALQVQNEIMQRKVFKFLCSTFRSDFRAFCEHTTDVN